MENKTNNQVADFGQTLINWSFPEYQQYQRGVFWYIGLIGVIGLLLIYSYKTNNVLFAIIIIMSAVFLTMHHRSEPREMEIKITEDGIVLNNTFYEYADFRNFAIIYRPPEAKNLYLEFKGSFRPRLTIPLENQNPNEVRNLLSEYLTENLERENEPLSDFLARIFKI
jgi:hypothetical protein